MKEISVVLKLIALAIASIILVCSISPCYASEPKVIYVSEGLALKDDGSTWSWGNGNSVPKQIGSMTGIKQIVSYYPGFAALQNDGTVWICINSAPPTQVQVLNDVLMLSSHYVLKNDGTVWLWRKVGSSESYEKAPLQVPGLSDVVYMEDKIAIKRDGTVWEWDVIRNDSYNPTDYNLEPAQVPITGIKKVSDSGMHALAVKEDGSVWAWRQNKMGQLGDGTYTSSDDPVKVKGLSDVIVISAGAFHSLALKNDGSVWAWGSNLCGQLGDPSKGDGSPIPIKVPGIDHVVQICACGETSIVLKSDGSVWAWGRNTDGELGDGTITDGTIHRPHNNGKDTPVRVLLNTGSDTSTPTPSTMPPATLLPENTPVPTSDTLQPTSTGQPSETSNPTIQTKSSATPTYVPLPYVSSKPAPGSNTIIILLSLLITTGIITMYVSKRK